MKLTKDQQINHLKNRLANLAAEYNQLLNRFANAKHIHQCLVDALMEMVEQFTIRVYPYRKKLIYYGHVTETEHAIALLVKLGYMKKVPGKMQHFYFTGKEKEWEK